MKILFDVNINSDILNYFPIEKFIYNDIYLSSNFNKKDNNIFYKKLILYGIKFIFMKKYINYNNFNLIIKEKDIKDNTNYEYKSIPQLYIIDKSEDQIERQIKRKSNGNNEENINKLIFVLCKICVTCGTINKILDDEFDVYKDILYLCNHTNDIVYEDLIKIDEEILQTYVKDNQKLRENKPNLPIFNEYLNIGSSRDEKFQDSMKKQAKRLEFATKKENYKKFMKQNTSLTLHNSKSLSINKNESINICKAKTKKGVRCTNKATNNTDYCGIPSHKK